MEQNQQLKKDKGPLLLHPEFYYHLVGRLIYLNLTRPYLAYYVQSLSQFMYQPH